LPRLILGLAMAAGAAALLWATRGQTFLGDEWGFYASYPGFDLEAMLEPRVGHLQLVPILLYKGVIGIVGPDGLTFRLILVALSLLCARLFFELARRRVGDWLALAPAVLLLVFGSAGEVFASTLGITVLATVALGLAMLLCLERRDLRGDVAGCALLAVALACYGPALAFAAGAVAEIVVVRGRAGWRRAWVFGLPLALYAGWRLWAGDSPDTPEVTTENLLQLPSAIYDSVAAALAAITGVFPIPDAPLPEFATGLVHASWAESLSQIVLVPLLLVGVGVWLVRRGTANLGRGSLVLIATSIAYWGAIGAVASAARPPTAPRYQYLSAIFLFLLAAELFRGVRPSRPAVAAIAVVLGLGVAGNLDSLDDFGRFYRANSDDSKAELAALDFARPLVNPGLYVELAGQPPGSLPDLLITAGEYFAAADAHGSPAYTSSELAGRSDEVRGRADHELVRALALKPRPGRGLPGLGGRIEADAVASGRLRARAGCLKLVPERGRAIAAVSLPQGGFSIIAPRPPMSLRLRRFGDSFLARLPTHGIRGPAVVEIPPDETALRWHLEVVGRTSVTICPP
jgi:hypothetical protein